MADIETIIKSSSSFSEKINENTKPILDLPFIGKVKNVWNRIYNNVLPKDKEVITELFVKDLVKWSRSIRKCSYTEKQLKYAYKKVCVKLRKKYHYQPRIVYIKLRRICYIE